MERIILTGDIPSPVNPPKGCKFHTRCENCMDICTRIAPNYKEVEAGHFCACHLYNTKEEVDELEEKYRLSQIEEEEKKKESKILSKLHLPKRDKVEPQEVVPVQTAVEAEKENVSEE